MGRDSVSRLLRVQDARGGQSLAEEDESTQRTCNCSSMAFRKLSVSMADEGGEASVARVRGVSQSFSKRFGRFPDGVARAPGRVNLIGEHVDYEGYAVLPMAIEQDVCIAFAVLYQARDNEEAVLSVEMEAADPSCYGSASLELPIGSIDVKPSLLSGKQRWANYVVCGVLGARDLLASHLNSSSGRISLQLMVDGRVPPACGLSSSSALVVASALATSAAIDFCGIVDAGIPSRLEMADACRRAERHVGTIGGGMDQAISCLGERGNALHISFTPSLQARSVKIEGMESKNGDGGYAFIVANSGVVAEKAVDAALRYNKRVVECALAAKLIGKKLALDNWEKVPTNISQDTRNQLLTMFDCSYVCLDRASRGPSAAHRGRQRLNAVIPGAPEVVGRMVPSKRVQRRVHGELGMLWFASGHSV